MSEQVKAGYKKTGVGVIPVDWAVSTITEAAEMTTVGFVGSMSHLFTKYGVPVLRGQDVLPNKLDASDTKFISIDTHQLWIKSALKGGDVVMVRVGASAGTSCVIPDSLGKANAASIVVIRPLKKRLDSDFLSAIINSDFGKRQVESLLVGGAQPVINTATVAAFQIPLPPISEQHSIAVALSEIDELINGLEQVITKKRGIQQAAMQQLLTGQRRLPGFSEEWDVKPMRALGNTYGGLAGKTKINFGHGEARYIPFMNVMTNTVIDASWLEPVDVAPDEAQNLAKKGDLFFNGSSETPGEVGFCSVLLEDIPNLFLNSFCFGFRFNTSAKVNGLFFAYWFRSKAGRAAMSVLAQGATRYNIAKSAFMKLEIPQPSEEEQTAIATVLSDMGTELAALETRRNKAHQLKQGMMQELLTGRIRMA